MDANLIYVGLIRFMKVFVLIMQENPKRKGELKYDDNNSNIRNSLLHHGGIDYYNRNP